MKVNGHPISQSEKIFTLLREVILGKRTAVCYFHIPTGSDGHAIYVR